MKVELTIRDPNGGVLTVTEAAGIHPHQATQYATRLAVAWAKRYGMPSVSQHTGWNWTVADNRGITQAQLTLVIEA